MNQTDALALLHSVRDGALTPEQALQKLRLQPFEDLGYAKVDHHRGLRQGAAEVIYGAGKTPDQICGIVQAMLGHGEYNILITRMSPDAAQKVGEFCQELEYHPLPKVGLVRRRREITACGPIAVVSGGTSDLPVCEEAALTAEALGNEVDRIYDVGVAGVHRLLSQLDRADESPGRHRRRRNGGSAGQRCRRLVDCPVIAVPTSVGYGASFHGLSALLSMLNSCASGLSVVNIDNGLRRGLPCQYDKPPGAEK